MNGPAWLLLGLPGLKWVSESKKQVQLKTNKNDMTFYILVSNKSESILSLTTIVGRSALYHFRNSLLTPLARVLKQGSNKCSGTVRPRDTRPQAARTSQVHVFELGPKLFEMHVFARFCTFLHVFARFFDK